MPDAAQSSVEEPLLFAPEDIPKRPTFWVTTYLGRIWLNEFYPTREAAENVLLATTYIENSYRKRPREDQLEHLEDERLSVRLATWQEREALRFHSTYRHPVWSNEGWWKARSAELQEHYAHYSVEEPNSIAFTENADKGERDIQARMRPGKYLKRFFGDVLTHKQIAYYAEWWRRGERPAQSLEDLGLVLGFAKTPSEITSVYKHGPSSCMDAEHFENRRHNPVRIYGAGDLAIAYLKASDSRKIYARALVWPEKKAFGRVYGDSVEVNVGTSNSRYLDNEEVAGLLQDTLKDQGYQSAYAEGWSIFDGARLKAIRARGEGFGYYVMPYLDGSLRIRGPEIDPETKRMVFVCDSANGRGAQDTSGYSYFPDAIAGREGYSQCCHCARPHRTRDMLEMVTRISSSGIPGPELERICTACRPAHRPWRDDVHGVWVSGNFASTVGRDGRLASRRYATAHPGWDAPPGQPEPQPAPAEAPEADSITAPLNEWRHVSWTNNLSTTAQDREALEQLAAMTQQQVLYPMRAVPQVLYNPNTMSFVAAGGGARSVSNVQAFVQESLASIDEDEAFF